MHIKEPKLATIQTSILEQIKAVHYEEKTYQNILPSICYLPL